MGLNDLLSGVTDPYDRQARLSPALLALFPLIAMLTLHYHAAMASLTGVAALAASLGGLYLLITLSRELGKSLEPGLFISWGGKPTTQLLRHRDAAIDDVSKHRYHSFLSKRIGHPFPTAEQEAANTEIADDVYESGVRWLLDHTRDRKKFAILFNENVAYGFRRNALGLKPAALSISLISIAWLLAANGIISGTPPYVRPEALPSLSIEALISLGLSFATAMVWVLLFTTAALQRAAFTYAEALLRTCDVLDQTK